MDTATVAGTAIDTATQASPSPFAALEMVTVDRAGYRAFCIAPPVGGNWDSKNTGQMRDALEALGIREGIVPNLRPRFSGRTAQESE